MEQTTIEKDKNKFTFDGKGKEDAVETLNKFHKDCNNKDFGRKISISDIIARGLRKLEQKDLALLQEQSMGLKDSLRQKYKLEKGLEPSEDEFIRWLLEDYSAPSQKTKKIK